MTVKEAVDVVPTESRILVKSRRRQLRDAVRGSRQGLPEVAHRPELLKCPLKPGMPAVFLSGATRNWNCVSWRRLPFHSTTQGS